jgi:magnesium-transporting ATPase (P-type)
MDHEHPKPKSMSSLKPSHHHDALPNTDPVTVTATATATATPPEAFSISPAELTALIDPKSIKTLSQIGGPAALTELLQTHLERGLSHLQEALQPRQDYFGLNLLPEKPTKSIFQLIWLALQDKVLIILIIAAVISLALGLYTTLGTDPKSYTDANGNTVTEPQVLAHSILNQSFPTHKSRFYIPSFFFFFLLGGLGRRGSHSCGCW